MSPGTWAWKRHPKGSPPAGFRATAGPDGEVQDERRRRALWDQVTIMQTEHSGTQGKAHTGRTAAGPLAKRSYSLPLPRKAVDPSFLQGHHQSGIYEAPGMCNGACAFLQGWGGGKKYRGTFSAMKPFMLSYRSKV